MIDKQIVAILLLYGMHVLFLFQADRVAAVLVPIKSSGYNPTGLIIQSTTSVNPLCKFWEHIIHRTKKYNHVSMYNAYQSTMSYSHIVDQPSTRNLATIASCKGTRFTCSRSCKEPPAANCGGMKSHTYRIHGTGIFTYIYLYIWLVFMVNVGKDSIHRGYEKEITNLQWDSFNVPVIHAKFVSWPSSFQCPWLFIKPPMSKNSSPPPIWPP